MSRVPLNAQMRLFWDITYRCNLRCTHCQVVGYKPAQEDVALDEPQTLRLLENIYAGPERVCELNIQGGEPTVARNFVPAVKWLGENGHAWSFITSGTAWTKVHTSLVSRFPPVRITFSVDGAAAETHDYMRGPGTFQKTRETIREVSACRRGAPIQLAAIYVVTRRNAHDVPKALSLLAEWGFYHVLLNPLVLDGAAALHGSELMPTVRQMDEVMTFVASSGHRIGNLSVTMRWLTPVMIEHYNKTLNRSDPLPVKTCVAIASTGFITPAGHFEPCPNMDRLRIGSKDLLLKSNSPETSLLVHSLSEARRSAYVSRTYERLFGTLSAPRPARCDRCSFASICSPCPSQHHRSRSPTEDLCFDFQDYVGAH